MKEILSFSQLVIGSFVVILAPFWAEAQTMQFVSSNRPADTSKQASAEVTTVVKNMHLMPLFGETSKSIEQIEFEINFLNDCDQNFASRTEASQFFSARGWEYLQEGDLDTACYRFNLAYLLDNKNSDCYWGLGVVCFQQGHLTDAERMLRKGADMDSTNVGLLVDLATVDLIHYKEAKENWELIEAEQILNRAERLDSTSANVYLKKSVLEFHKGNYDAAWAHLHKTRLLDIELLDYEFMKELLAKKCDPQGIFSTQN
jgi:tetratricopeptide (TPR) repeat protein